jgi:hypothetical protein
MAPKAESAAFSGVWSNEPPFGPRSEFRYSVLRLWEIPVESFLEGPLSLLPLVPMAKVAKAELSSLAEIVGKEAAFRS